MGLDILEKCERKENLTARDRRQITSTLANFMLQTLKDTSRAKAGELASILCQKYPKKFADRIGNEKWSDGVRYVKITNLQRC